MSFEGILNFIHSNQPQPYEPDVYPKVFHVGGATCLKCDAPGCFYLGQGDWTDLCGNCCPEKCAECGGGTGTVCETRRKWVDMLLNE